jgi:hypothetical protein
MFLFGLEHVERARRIDARRSPDELDHLPKLGGAELGPFMRPATDLPSAPPGQAQRAKALYENRLHQQHFATKT